MAGLRSGEDLFAPVWHSARNRSPWLFVNLITAFLATRFIGLFESTIQGLVALATLMPIVASIGGNTGNQTVALVIRGLAYEQLTQDSRRHLLRKEMIVSLLNGLVWGGLVGLFAGLVYQRARLGLVMTAAIMLNLVIAAAVGVLVPLALQRSGRDPGARVERAADLRHRLDGLLPVPGAGSSVPVTRLSIRGRDVSPSASTRCETRCGQASHCLHDAVALVVKLLRRLPRFRAVSDVFQPLLRAAHEQTPFSLVDSVRIPGHGLGRSARARAADAATLSGHKAMTVAGRVSGAPPTPSACGAICRTRPSRRRSACRT